MSPEGINSLCQELGITRSDINIPLHKVYHHIRAHLEETSPRALGVLRPLKLVRPLSPHHPLRPSQSALPASACCVRACAIVAIALRCVVVQRDTTHAARPFRPAACVCRLSQTWRRTTWSRCRRRCSRGAAARLMAYPSAACATSSAPTSRSRTARTTTALRPARPSCCGAALLGLHRALLDRALPLSINATRRRHHDANTPCSARRSRACLLCRAPTALEWHSCTLASDQHTQAQHTRAHTQVRVQGDVREAHDGQQRPSERGARNLRP